MRHASVMAFAAAALLALLTAHLSRAQAAPSFDCSRARLPDEVAVCSDPMLARVELEYASRYRAGLRRGILGGGAGGGASEARDELRFRHMCGNDRLCILDRLGYGLPDPKPAWFEAYHDRLVQDVASDDLSPKSYAHVGVAGGYPSGQHGEDATLVDVRGLDTASASAVGDQGPSDDREFCDRTTGREPSMRRELRRCLRAITGAHARLTVQANCAARTVYGGDDESALKDVDADGTLNWVTHDGEYQPGGANPTVAKDQVFELLCPNTLAALRARAATNWRPGRNPLGTTFATRHRTPIDQFAPSYGERDGETTRPAPFAASPPRAMTAIPPDDELGAYVRVGVVRCALPGTSAEFELRGDGSAELTGLVTDLAPVRAAGGAKAWTALTTRGDAEPLLVLDSHAGVRVIASLDSGRARLFAGDRNGSELLCRTLVTPG